MNERIILNVCHKFICDVEETYRDEEAFRTHMATEHGKIFNKAIETLVENGASQVVFLDRVL